MSKQECRPAYLRHKMALDAAISPKGDVKVADIFKRKPYTAANDLGEILKRKKAKAAEKARHAQGRAGGEAPGMERRYPRPAARAAEALPGKTRGRAAGEAAGVLPGARGRDQGEEPEELLQTEGEAG